MSTLSQKLATEKEHHRHHNKMHLKGWCFQSNLLVSASIGNFVADRLEDWSHQHSTWWLSSATFRTGRAFRYAFDVPATPHLGSGVPGQLESYLSTSASVASLINTDEPFQGPPNATPNT